MIKKIVKEYFSNSQANNVLYSVSVFDENDNIVYQDFDYPSTANIIWIKNKQAYMYYKGKFSDLCHFTFCTNYSNIDGHYNYSTDVYNMTEYKLEYKLTKDENDNLLYESINENGCYCRQYLEKDTHHILYEEHKHNIDGNILWTKYTDFVYSGNNLISAKYGNTTINYEYNEKNQLIQIIRLQEEIMEDREEYIYNDNGELEEKICYMPDGCIRVRFKYEYIYI